MMLERKAKKIKTNYILIFEVRAARIKPEKNRRLAVPVFFCYNLYINLFMTFAVFFFLIFIYC